jgi:TetR/AcrR family transcriptional regulator, repressor for uid operon
MTDPLTPPTASRKPGRPVASKADETRRRIVRAAREIFCERGYDGTTFQAIAERADLTRPAINHYFADKRVLYSEVLDQTNEVVVMVGIERAKHETALMGRVTEFISAAMHATSEDPSVTAFLLTAVVESQQHPELGRSEIDAVSNSREFLNWAINDAIKRGELKKDIDAPLLTETLLTVLCGVGFYAGYVKSYREMQAVNKTLRQLLEGAFWRHGTP